MKDQVIILDEAHNIEDISRDVSSVSFREDHLQATAHECETLAKQRAEDFTTYDTLKTFLLNVMAFLKDMSLDKVVSIFFYLIKKLLAKLNFSKFNRKIYFKKKEKKEKLLNRNVVV